MTHTVEHSGQTWTCLGRSPNGRPIWPIEEYLARSNHTPEDAERIREANPDGKEEAACPKGWDPTKPLPLTSRQAHAT